MTSECVCLYLIRVVQRLTVAPRVTAATALRLVRQILAGGLLLSAIEMGVANASDHSDHVRFRDREFEEGAWPSVEALTAAELAEEGEEGRIERDRPARTINPLTPFLFYGGKVESEFDLEKNFNLDNDDDDDLATLEPQLSIALSYVPSPRALAFANFELSRKFDIVDDVGNRDRETKLEVTRAYVILREIIEGLSLQLGRQNYDDKREWVLDETLDSGRILYSVGDFDLELAAGRENLFGEDLLNDEDKDRVNTYILFADYEIVDDIDLSGYVVKRDDREEKDGSPVFFGVRSMGEVDVFDDDEIEYWLDLSTVRGDDNGTDIRGYGLDVGATYFFDLPYEPHFTLGYAFGTGDSDPDSGTDKAFRQTGIEGNSDDFGGVVSLKYYGEVADPELSNLHVFTAGVGMSPTERSSIDLVFHAYRQDKISDDFEGSSIDLDPNEDGSRESKRLGSEIDLVVGFKDIVPDLDFDFTFGYFFSGRAFRIEVEDDVFEDADDAFFIGFDFDYSF
jgi:alginate production protein